MKHFKLGIKLGKSSLNIPEKGCLADVCVDGCGADVCITDNVSGCGVDTCNVDNSGCGSTNFDWCDIDNNACLWDQCGTDNGYCYGSVDFCHGTDNGY